MHSLFARGEAKSWNVCSMTLFTLLFLVEQGQFGMQGACPEQLSIPH